ncbi:MAG: hypothetical protein LH478_06250 [Chitinophagaceae bacterium]|nr:hypothetical protein [Chitinophagaceae bacterium]
MKIINRVFLCSLLLICNICFSQKQVYKQKNSFGLTVNAGPGSFATALSWTHFHAVGKTKRFSVGYGLRFTNFIGSDLDYITAPAKFTSGKSSIAALFSDNILANIDTVSFPKSQTYFLNTGIYLSYLLPYWKNRLELGVNIDALGVTFGPRQNALYKNNTAGAKPTTFNLLLISDSDRGSLNSEWYASFWVTPRVAVKAGFEFLFSEYTTDTKIQQLPNLNETNDRFRFKSSMIMLGVSFAPFRK